MNVLVSIMNTLFIAIVIKYSIIIFPMKIEMIG